MKFCSVFKLVLTVWNAFSEYGGLVAQQNELEFQDGSKVSFAAVGR